MPITMKNLSSELQAAIRGGYADIGQTHYLVDSNYRTAAQGWTRADGTGPLDLYAEMSGGQYLFRTGDYSSDSLAMKAAIDAMVDYRGDICFFTPGTYSPATALAFNVPNARYLGPAVSQPRRSAVTFNDSIGDHVLSVNDCEFAFIKFVPLTATSLFQIAAGDRAFFHHFYYNADGVAASTSTEFLNISAAVSAYDISDFAVLIDAAQGDFITAVSPQRFMIERGKFWVEGDTWASALTFSTTPIGNLVDLLHINGSGASSVLTNFYTGAANKDMQIMATRIYINGTLMSTASAIETGCGTTGDIDIAECYQTGDASGEGGVVIALA